MSYLKTKTVILAGSKQEAWNYIEKHEGKPHNFLYLASVRAFECSDLRNMRIHAVGSYLSRPDYAEIVQLLSSSGCTLVTES